MCWDIQYVPASFAAFFFTAIAAFYVVLGGMLQHCVNRSCEPVVPPSLPCGGRWSLPLSGLVAQEAGVNGWSLLTEQRTSRSLMGVFDDEGGVFGMADLLQPPDIPPSCPLWEVPKSSAYWAVRYRHSC